MNKHVKSFTENSEYIPRNRKHDQYVYNDDHVLVPLSKGKFAKIDYCDLEEIKKHSWNCSVSAIGLDKMPLAYARSKHGGYMHRLIMRPTKGMVIDHINHDCLDNRRKNLRLCTHRQNIMHQRKTRGVSKYMGVRYATDKRIRRWIAHIKGEGKVRTVGAFHTEDEAALAYNDAAEKYFGEFATLNIVERRERA